MIAKALPSQPIPISIERNRKAFISYNHKDKKVADELKIQLEKAGIDITIDIEDMLAGEDIKRFIEESIKNTDVALICSAY